MNKNRVLRLFEVQLELGVSRWTLYEWLSEGKLQGFKLPCGHYRVPVSEVERIKKNVPIPLTHNQL
jgi:excisionase family DNA binding protein